MIIKKIFALNKMSYSIILAGIKGDTKILTDLKEPVTTYQLPGSPNKVRHAPIESMGGYDVFYLINNLSGAIMETIRMKKGTTDVEKEIKDGEWAVATMKGGRRRTNKVRRNRRNNRSSRRN